MTHSTAVTVTPSLTLSEIKVCKILTHLKKLKESREVTRTIAINKPKAEALQTESTPTAAILFLLTKLWPPKREKVLKTSLIAYYFCKNLSKNDLKKLSKH